MHGAVKRRIRFQSLCVRRLFEQTKQQVPNVDAVPKSQPTVKQKGYVSEDSVPGSQFTVQQRGHIVEDAVPKSAIAPERKDAII